MRRHPRHRLHGGDDQNASSARALRHGHRPIRSRPNRWAPAARSSWQRNGCRGDGTHVLNSDTWLQYRRSRSGGRAPASTPMAIALARVDDVARYGAVDVDDGRARGFRERRGRRRLDQRGLLFPRRGRAVHVPARVSILVRTRVLQPRARRPGRVAAFTRTSGFIDIGVPEDYARAQPMFAARAGPCRAAPAYLDPPRPRSPRSRHHASAVPGSRRRAQPQPRLRARRCAHRLGAGHLRAGGAGASAWLPAGGRDQPDPAGSGAGCTTRPRSSDYTAWVLDSSRSRGMLATC